MWNETNKCHMTDSRLCVWPTHTHTHMLTHKSHTFVSSAFVVSLDCVSCVWCHRNIIWEAMPSIFHTFNARTITRRTISRIHFDTLWHPKTEQPWLYWCAGVGTGAPAHYRMPNCVSHISCRSLQSEIVKQGRRKRKRIDCIRIGSNLNA